MLCTVPSCIDEHVLAARRLAGLRLMFWPVYLFYWLVAWLVGLGPKFLDNGSQPTLRGSPRNLHTSLVWGQDLKPTFENFSPRFNFADDRRQSHPVILETTESLNRSSPNF